MSKDAPALHDLPLTQETPATQTSQETFNAFLNAPVTKLDADEYMANDLDGVTESLIGSGNMNFLMMQAGQTDEAMTNSNPFDIQGSDIALAPSGLLGGNSFAPAEGGGNGDTAMDRGFDMPNALDGLSDSGNGGQNNTAGSLGASSAAANSQSLNPLSDATSFSSANTGSNGSNGGNGNNGNNGTDGEGGGNTTVNNTTNVTNTTENTVVDNSVTIGDTNIDIIDDSILETVENIYNTTNDFLTTTVTNVTNTVNNLINNIFEGNPLDIGPIGISLDAALDDLLDLDLDFINGDQILSVLDEVIDLSPVTNLVEGLTGDLVADLGLDVILDPFQYDNSPNDYDVHVGLDILDLGLPDIDIPLNELEFLLGDIDVGLDLTEDILDLLPPLIGGADNGDTNLALNVLDDIPGLAPVTGIVDGVFNSVEDLAGDVDILGNLHVGLLGIGADGTGPDTDLTIPLNIGLLDNAILNDALNISLDPLENLLGDIDLDLGVATNILGDTAGGLIDNLSGGTGTDNILANVGNALHDTIGDLLPFGGQSGDTDLLLNAGLDIPGQDILSDGTEILLNPVEDLVGDIDIAGDLGIDLLGLGGGDTGPDTDITIPIQIDLVDSELLNDGLDISLDPLENLIGDVDLDLDVAGDLLGNMADGLIDNGAGGTGTDSLLAGLGDTLSDTVGGILPMEGTAGDTDILLDTGLNVLGTDVVDDAGDILLDPVENLLGDIDITGNSDIDLFNVGDAFAPTDSDLTIDLSDAGIPEIPVDLGIFEGVVGDIDLDVMVSQDVLDTLQNPGSLLDNVAETVGNTIDTAVNLIDNLPTNTGGLDLGALLPSDSGGLDSALPSWTETILPDAGSLLGDGLAGLTNILPDPVAAAPVIALPVIPVIPVPHLGGGHHFGGLFG